MLAVLNDALLTLARHCGAADYRAQKRVSEVDVWVASDDVEWPFAFVNVCDALHLDASRVRTLLEFTSKQFEFTVVDVPRTESGALDALDGMKSIVVVTTQELPSVRSAAGIAGRLRQRYGKERVLVIVNRSDNRSDIRHEDIEQVLGGPIAHAFPSDYRLTMAALTRGRPVVLDNHSSLAASFEKFARSLAGLKTEKSDAQAASGWLGRLTGRK